MKSIRPILSTAHWKSIPPGLPKHCALIRTHALITPLNPPQAPPDSTTTAHISPSSYNSNSSSSSNSSATSTPTPTPVFYPRHPSLPSRAPPAQTPPLTEPTPDASVDTLLPLLRSQPPYYSTIHIHGKPYLVTEGDEIRLPFLMQGVEPGDVLRLNRVTAIGSRDYTLKAGTKVARGEKQKYLDERLFTIRARVLGSVMEPEREKRWHVQRRRHVKHIKSQHSFTLVKISELKVNSLPKPTES